MVQQPYSSIYELFEKESNMTDSAQTCAHAIIEVVPPIVQALRVQMRAQRSHDLSVPQFRTLAYIRNHPCCSLTAVAEFIGLTLPAMSTLVNGLVEQGLVQREIDPADRRRVLLTVTDAGIAMHRRALDGAEAWLAARVASLTDDQRTAVLAAMAALGPLFSEGRGASDDSGEVIR
jgi:DNA-binding MarR family transcriptional regulator